MHTPGPWSEPVNYASRFEVQGSNKRVAIADTLQDARLIAAAPDLLEALQAIVAASHFPNACTPGLMDAIDKARAAIAKAINGEPS